jgi:putative PIN family toxin of toxin-antitoxin system
MAIRAVIDTNVLVAALLGPRGPNRRVIRSCLEGRVQPQMSNALFAGYEEVTSRPEIRDQCPLAGDELEALLDAFFSICRWVEVFYLWRPNLPDEADNHILELALASGAPWLITNNVRDFRQGELRIGGVRICTPKEFLEAFEP